MSSTPGQIMTSVVWSLVIVGILLTHAFVLWVVLVLLLWGILIAHLWRGPLKPSLLIRRRVDTSHWVGATYRVKMPSDYVRLGEPVPASAIAWWWVGTIICGIVTVVFTHALLTGRIWK